MSRSLLSRCLCSRSAASATSLWASASEEGELLARSLYTVIPNLQILWLADAVTQDMDLSLTYVALVSAHSLFYVGAVLGVAIALFQTREVG